MTYILKSESGGSINEAVVEFNGAVGAAVA